MDAKHSKNVFEKKYTHKDRAMLPTYHMSFVRTVVLLNNSIVELCKKEHQHFNIKFNITELKFSKQ